MIRHNAALTFSTKSNKHLLNLELHSCKTKLHVPAQVLVHNSVKFTTHAKKLEQPFQLIDEQNKLKEDNIGTNSVFIAASKTAS